MSTGTLTSKGQTTIPKDIRDALGLKTGDQLIFRIDNGRIMVQPKIGSVKDLRGLIAQGGRRKAASVDKMNQGITQALSESVIPAKPRVK